MSLLEETLLQIKNFNEDIYHENLKLWSEKIENSENFGKLKPMVAQIAAITGEVVPKIQKKCMILACSDHGYAKRNVSAFPLGITVNMTKNYLIAKGAGANALAHFANADMVVVDVGVNANLEDVPNLINKKIAYGTKDFIEEDAMTRKQAQKSIEIGIEIVQKKIAEGYRIFSIGEMAIGNTTSSAAITAAFTGLTAEEVTGRGTNISDERYLNKISVVAEALIKRKPNAQDGLDVLAKVGGFEFGTMAGIILGAAAKNGLVIIDGFNATAAALIANALMPKSKKYIMASHISQEQGHIKALQKLNLNAYVDLEFRLGEATGASIQMHTLDLAIGTFQALSKRGEK